MKDRYETLDKNHKLVWNLRDIGHTMRHISEGRGSQKRILMFLREFGEITQRELTERLGIQPGSASEVIGKLETAGFLVRTPSYTDRRTTNIALTEEGKTAAEEAALQREERHQQMFSCLSGEEQDTLLSLLEKLNADWETKYRQHGAESDCRKGRGHHHHHHKRHKEA
ncbi:MAG: MarR family transcriptional regulator [Oscillibacter sp.]|nr:MarR family transcriptional regulator [Oscillibacter sp.]